MKFNLADRSRTSDRSRHVILTRHCVTLMANLLARYSKLGPTTRHTHMSTDNLQSGGMTPNIDGASLMKGLNPAQGKGKV